MYINDVKPQGGFEEHDEVTQQFLSDPDRKGLRNAVEEVVESEFARLEEWANQYISGVAADRAEMFLRRVLEGDKDAARQLFCVGGGRYKVLSHEEGQPWAHVIHGRIFETEAITLRRQLVEAHADLLRNERIADLESIVEGLRQQVVKLEKQKEDCQRRL